MLRSAVAQMLPPRPPSPPSGPPFGMNFSRRNDTIPLPPSPAMTSMCASSMNFIPDPQTKKAPRCGAFVPTAAGLLLQRLDADRAALLLALDGETHLAVDQREQRVVLAPADVLAGMEAGAALAHDDRARADGLAAVGLDAEHLRLGIAAVPGGTAALFLCHVCSSLA